MLSLKDYGIALAKGLLPLVVAIALVNLINASNWQYLLNYYVICNYLTFYPYNLNQAKLAYNMGVISIDSLIGNQSIDNQKPTANNHDAESLRLKAQGI